jgi:hypothetical protein
VGLADTRGKPDYVVADPPLEAFAAEQVVDSEARRQAEAHRGDREPFLRLVKVQVDGADESLTNHAQVPICIAHDPGIRLHDIGGQAGITERETHRVVAELDAAGYIHVSERASQPLHDQRLSPAP